jgi:tetratricopeptide (TPR) repeat protein
VLFPFQAGPTESQQVLAAQLTEALQTALQETRRYEVLLLHPQALLVRRALASGALAEEQLKNTADLRTRLAVAQALGVEAALSGEIISYAFLSEQKRATGSAEVNIDVQEVRANRLVAFRAVAEAQTRTPRAPVPVLLVSGKAPTGETAPPDAAQRRATTAALARILVERLEEYWPVLPPKEKPAAETTPPEPANPEAPADPREEARQKAAVGDTRAAARAYTAAIVADPANVALYVELGDMLAAADQWDQAVNQYERAVRVDGRYLPAHRRLAEAYHRLKRPKEEIEAWRRVIALGEEDAEVERALAEAYLANGDYAEAVAQYERVLQVTDDPYGLLLELGRLAEERPDLPSAAARYEAALALRPQDPAAHEQLLAFHLRQRQSASALARLREILRLTGEETAKKTFAPDLYRSVLHLLDGEIRRLREKFEALRSVPESGDQPVDQIKPTLEEMDRQAQDLLNLADRLQPDEPYRLSYRHRTLAYSLLDQAVVEYLQYLDTG